MTEKRKNWNDCRTFQTLFEHYLKDILLPHLNGNSVLVMDNMKSHHAIQDMYRRIADAEANGDAVKK